MVAKAAEVRHVERVAEHMGVAGEHMVEVAEELMSVEVVAEHMSVGAVEERMSVGAVVMRMSVEVVVEEQEEAVMAVEEAVLVGAAAVLIRITKVPLPALAPDAVEAATLAVPPSPPPA